MKVLLLTTDAYGANGGIALYNRDIIEALVAMPEVDEVVVVARHTPQPATGAPTKARLIANSGGGKLALLGLHFRLPVRTMIWSYAAISTCYRWPFLSIN